MDLLYDPDANYSQSRTTQPLRPREITNMEFMKYAIFYILFE